MTNSTVNRDIVGSSSNKSNALLITDNENDNDTELFSFPSLWDFSSYTDWEGRISLRLVTMGIVIPVIAVVGIATNALNVAVLARLTKRKASPVFRILLAMAAADILVTMCFLLNGLLLYARPDPVLFSADVFRLSEAGRVIYYGLNPAMNLFSFTSNWCTVAMATFRFVAVYFPMKASKWCSRRRATVTVAAIVAVAVLITVPPEVLIACRSPSNDSSFDLSREYRTAYAIASDVLPWIICVILVSLLLITFSKPWSHVTVPLRRNDRKMKQRRQLTVTLVSTAAWFVIMTAPSTATVVIKFWDSRSLYSSTSLYRLFYIGQILALMNFNGNFFFYSFINGSHRQQLKELLHISSHSQRLNKSTSTSSKQANATLLTTVP